ncbi:TerD family protein [Frankia sp. AiPs1]|uniref:TerD family protein n=1 Tax=Frankia sp. AiPs1 TaxID=573493 RepID=UPI002042EA27|nr:TerD family protein [Frankia sp. AiPs1]MCM3922277.1 TerD family protein [Frankia sp. AiPs1]
MTLASTLQKGANAPVPAGLLRVAVGWAPGRLVDVCAVLVTEEERVRSDGDFVFFNAPSHPSGAVALTAVGPGTAGLVVTLPRVEPAVRRIVIAGSLDAGTFADLADLAVELTDRAGRPVARFVMESDEPVTALVLGELYRRANGWRFRAVAQGWDTGLAGLARGFGINVRADPDAAGHADPDAVGDADRDLDGDAPTGTYATSTSSTSADVTGNEPTGDEPTGDEPTRVLPEIDADALSTDAFSADDTEVAAEDGVDAEDRVDAEDGVDAEAAGETGEEAGGGEDAGGEGGGGEDAGGGGEGAVQAEVPRNRSPRPARRIRADWYPDPVRPDHMRWWDGDRWQGPPTPILTESDTSCGRCGARKRRRLLGEPPACEECARAIRAYLWDWRARVVSSLTRDDPTGADLEPLWADLRYQRIPESAGWEIVRAVGPAHLERLAAFAFADGVIEPAEVDRIEAAAGRLHLAGPDLDALRQRLARGLELTRIGAGELPRLPAGALHIELDEIVHLDVPATLVQQTADGPRHAPGRLLATNRKLRFLGETGRGAELGLSKIVEVEARGGCVDIAATTTRGSGSYLVDDPQYVAAVLAGILRIARRQVIAPGSRASRTIPQEVKAEVWRRDGGVCVECGGGEHLEFDHVIPYSRGGASSVNNLQLLCRRCNRSKGARI